MNGGIGESSDSLTRATLNANWPQVPFMMPDISKIIFDYYHTILSPVPRPLRIWVLLGALAVVLWLIGTFANEPSEEVPVRIIQGANMTWSGLGRAADASAPYVEAGARGSGRWLTSAGRGALDRGGDLVEVEEAPIKIGPLVEIHGVKIGLIGLLLAFIGSMWAFPELFPFSP